MSDTVIIYDDQCGLFEQGVPARDLTEGEWMEIPKETRNRLVASKMYFEIGTDGADAILTRRFEDLKNIAPDPDASQTGE